MLDLKELENIWANLPEPVKNEILAYATALIADTKTISPEQQRKLWQRLNKYEKQESAISWSHLYNQMLQELI